MTPIKLLEDYVKEIIHSKKLCIKSNNIEDAEKIQEIENNFYSAINLINYWTDYRKRKENTTTNFKIILNGNRKFENAIEASLETGLSASAIRLNLSGGSKKTRLGVFKRITDKETN